MSDPFHYSTKYVLDKPHFAETFDESHVPASFSTRYTKAFLFVATGGLFLLFTDIDGYVPAFFVALGVLEALSVRFQRSWWLARQMMSRAANSEMTLTIDEQGVSTKSFYVDSLILWENVIRMEQTEQGWLIYHDAGKSYLSGRCLSEEATQFVKEKAAQK